ncbi:unnamed protein product [Vitrella brassicaformis CCMP3155]|uniref:AAA+ ATPase domain-containing protein n=2 Tax=Vitrella brassicaformis TaxID=1169539 RepID=A0A0G4EKE4_VITBC|nr:unnamed protein product [Vitrella brassicaformis CCMP3155]|eukprot:CEL97915.1 unnamed protein product [Vitrella brassicaformis CCMP3155]
MDQKRRFQQRLSTCVANLEAHSPALAKDPDEIARRLQESYPDYKRKKVGALKQWVKDAMATTATARTAADGGGGKKDTHADNNSSLTPANPVVSTASNNDQMTVDLTHDKPPSPSPSNSSGLINSSLRTLYQQPQPQPKQDDTQDGSKPQQPPAKKARVGDGSEGERRKDRRGRRREMDGAMMGSSDRSFAAPIPDVTLQDMGGIDKVLELIRELVIYPLVHPEVFRHLGVQPATGVLLHGPPGSGKTQLANAIAGTAKVPFFKLAATEIVSGMSGESEALVRSLFEAARASAPSLVFIDEIDAVCPKRENAAREMEKRIVAQILSSLDELGGSFVIVLGATNRPDALDPALRRAGRFDREIAMGIPDETARGRILQVLSRGLRLAGDVDFTRLARLTPGFVGADLSAVMKEAALFAIKRVFSQLDPNKPTYSQDELSSLAIQEQDFEHAIECVQPSARREGFTTIPNITWEQVGGLQALKKELTLSICEPIRRPEIFHRLGLDIPAGVLLHGPPGCGKTLLAKAVAKESGANLIAIKGPELLNKYVGESEKAVREVFQRARVSAPCIIFFDELDSLCPKRSAEGTSASERVVNQLLTEMDGILERREVYVIAATNRADLIDPAMLRPGRLDKILYVPLPDIHGREDILRRLAIKTPWASDVTLDKIAHQTDGYSGADLQAVIREATLAALEQWSADTDREGQGQEGREGGEIEIGWPAIERALAKVKPSVSAAQQVFYKEAGGGAAGGQRS